VPVLQGEQDLFLPKRHFDWLAAHIPRSRRPTDRRGRSHSSSAESPRFTPGCWSALRSAPTGLPVISALRPVSTGSFRHSHSCTQRRCRQSARTSFPAAFDATAARPPGAVAVDCPTTCARRGGRHPRVTVGVAREPRAGAAAEADAERHRAPSQARHF
jgi:hypothetical protein